MNVKKHNIIKTLSIILEPSDSRLSSSLLTLTHTTLLPSSNQTGERLYEAAINISNHPNRNTGKPETKTDSGLVV